jgi:hypothetical protein
MSCYYDLHPAKLALALLNLVVHVNWHNIWNWEIFPAKLWPGPRLSPPWWLGLGLTLTQAIGPSRPGPGCSFGPKPSLHIINHTKFKQQAVDVWITEYSAVILL